MTLKAKFQNRLWIKIVSAISGILLLVMGALIVVNNAAQTKALMDLSLKHNLSMAETIESTIFDALAIGDNETVVRQFDRLRQKNNGTNIFVFGFDRNVAFTTLPTVQGSLVDNALSGPPTVSLVEDLLRTGNTPDPVKEHMDGKTYYSVFVPIRNEKRCYHCHGRSRDILGGIGVQTDISEELVSARTLEYRAMAIGVAVIVILSGLIFLMFHKLVNKPLSRLLMRLKDIAKGEGDLTMRLEVASKDEVGELARWFNVFIEKLQGMITEIATDVKTISSSSTQLSSISEQMAQGVQNVSETSNSVSSAAEKMNANMNSVAAAMEQSATNTNMVADASREMSSTIGEIAQNADKAKMISDEASQKTSSASENMEQLGAAANSIGKVVETITEISEQVNLLALNATIEAARAGDAGKGFAVVANEIKDLAKQTSEAAQEIKEKIESTQTTTGRTVAQISEINQVITDVNGMVTEIAKAVDQQSSVTREISTNVAQASNGIQEVNRNVNQSSTVSAEISADIKEVSSSMGEMSASSTQVNQSAQELLKLSEDLKELVGQFKY